MSQQSSLEKVSKGLRNPRLVCREINRVSHRLFPPWNYQSKGSEFLQEDWDNLLILDACRYDIFESENTIPGKLEHRFSKASSTVDFLRTNVDGAELNDTVYVTANGQINNHREILDVNFYDVVPLYADEWDEELGTVPPGAVTERAIQAEQEYPDKRLLIHYVQPHFPFIAADTEADKHRIKDSEYDKVFWRRVFDGDTDLSRNDLWTAYRDTLRLALEHAGRAVEELAGRTVVTSDHGNMFGERGHPIPIREWGHPSELYYGPLVKVPWLVSESDSRKSVVAEQPLDQAHRPDPAVVEERLRDLGYK